MAAVDALKADIYHYDVVTISEPTHLSSGGIVGWDTRIAVVADANKPRAALLIVNVKSGFLVVTKSRGILAVQIETGAASILVISVYMSPNELVVPATFAQLDAIVSSAASGTSVVLLGDFNVWSPLWVDWCECNRGKALTELIVGNGLTVLNDPTYVRERVEEELD